MCPCCFMHFTNRLPVPSVFFQNYTHIPPLAPIQARYFPGQTSSKQTVFDSFKCTFVYISEVMSLVCTCAKFHSLLPVNAHIWCDRVPTIVFTPSYGSSRSFACAMIWSLVTNKNVTFLIFERAQGQASMASAVNIWLLIGAWRLARETNLSTVLPIPSHGLLPRDLAKKWQR